MRRCVAVLAACAAALSAQFGLATVAAADTNPPGAVTLANGLSVLPNRVTPLVASSTYAVYRTEGNFSGPDYSSVPATGGSVQALTLPDHTRPSSLHTSLLTGRRTDTGDVYWWNLANGATGHGASPVSVSNPDTTDAYLSASADGWLSAGKDTSHAIHLFDTATTGANVDLGTPPGLSGTVHATSGPSGAVIYTSTAADYLDFSSRSFTPLDIPPVESLRCVSVAASVTGCSAYNPALDTDVALRVPLNGTPATQLPANFDDRTAMAVTGTATGWSTDGRLASVPVGSTTPSFSTFRIDYGFDDRVVSTGNTFVVATGRTATSRGIYAVSDATATPTRLAAAGFQPMTAADIAVGPGRVAWTDDQTSTDDVWSRTLANSGISIAPGPPTLVGLNASSLVRSSSSGFGLSVSGDVTGYSVPGSDVIAQGGNQSVLALGDAGLGPQVSGNRVLFAESDGNGLLTYKVRDLRTGVTTVLRDIANTDDLPSFSTRQVTLWGNYVAYFAPDGSIWRRDLTSTAPPTQLRPAVPVRDFWFGLLFAYGDEVGWRFFDRAPNAESTSTESGFRNAATLTPAIVLPAGQSISQLSSNGVVVQTVDTQNITTYSLRPYGGTTLSTVVSGAQLGPISIDDNIAGWIGSDGLPKVAPLPRVANQPRYLGAGVAGASLRIGHTTWSAAYPTSAGLTACSATIKSGTKVVRTLACNPAAMALGDVSLSWDGKDGHGHLMRAGAYSWTLAAGNADGPLRAADGSAGHFGGSITATGATTTLTLHPAHRSVAAHTTDRLTGQLRTGAGGIARHQAIGLYRRAHGNSPWMLWKSLTTDRAGRFHATPNVASATDYQVRFAGDPGDLPSTSTIVTVTVTTPKKH